MTSLSSLRKTLTCRLSTLLGAKVTMALGTRWLETNLISMINIHWEKQSTTNLKALSRISLTSWNSTRLVRKLIGKKLRQNHCNSWARSSSKRISLSWPTSRRHRSTVSKSLCNCRTSSAAVTLTFGLRKKKTYFWSKPLKSSSISKKLRITLSKPLWRGSN